MLFKLARTLQFVGLFVLIPIGIAGEVLERITLKEMLYFAGAGMVVFFAGWLLQQSVRPH